MNETGIGWTDFTWNVWSGCKKKSSACAHCYAETFAENKRGTVGFPHGFDLTVRPHKLTEPRKTLKNAGPALIFVGSMTDIGLDDDELKPDEIDRMYAAGFESMDRLRDAVLEVIEATPEHRYQLVTKRPRVLLRYLRDRYEQMNAVRHRDALPPNVWVLVTVENAYEAKERLPVLHEIRETFFGPQNVAGVSIEPLLDAQLARCRAMIDAATWLDWMIIGGESGVHFSEARNAGRFLVERVGHCKRCNTTWSRGDGCPECGLDRTTTTLAPKLPALAAVRALLELKRGPDVLARAEEAIRAAGFHGLAGGVHDTSVRSIHRSLLSHVGSTMRTRAAVDAIRAVEACFVPTFFKQFGGPRPDSAGRTLDGRTYDEMPTVPGALPERRVALGAATAGLARKLPVV